MSYISEIDLMNFRGKIRDHEMGKLRTLLKRWDELDIPGMTPEAVAYLKKVKLKANPNIGANVLTNDPDDGPFDHQELGALVAALDCAYGNGEISVREILLVKLFISYGARSKSFAAMKIKDFLTEKDNGMVRFYLNIPKAKQHMPIRATFDNRPLHPKIGVLFETWEKLLLLEYEEKINDGIEKGELPLFPNWHRENVIGMEHHPYTTSITYEAVRITNKLKIISARKKGTQLKVNMYRFRYTFGTRLGELGYSQREIAQALGHVTIWYAGVYLKRTFEFMANLDEAFADEYAPFVQAFKGKIILDGQRVKATDGSDPITIGKVGKCGKPGPCCARSAGCYRCPDFFAFVNGPHEEKRSEFIQERNRLIARGDIDNFIIETLDESIYAAAEVIQKCRDMKHSKGDV